MCDIQTLSNKIYNIISLNKNLSCDKLYCDNGCIPNLSIEQIVQILYYCKPKDCLEEYLIQILVDKSNDYEVEIYINYEYLRGKMELPDIFSKCDYFLFQNYKKKIDEDAKYDLDYIKQNILKKDCITLCFPTLHSNKLIFCYDCESPENEKTITKENPGGDFSFGISIIREYYNKMSKLFIFYLNIFYYEFIIFN
jgi:hypothetical protein